MAPMEIHGLDEWLGYLIGILLGVAVQGEGQAYFVLMFQPLAQRQKVTYDLNPLNHIDPVAIPVMMFAGWGWSRKRVVEPPYFPDSWICRCLVPLSGAIGILMLVGILGSLHMVVPFAALEVAIKVNILLAVANLLIPIPPLALGRALCCPFRDSIPNRPIIEVLGGIVLTGLVLTEKLADWPFMQSWVSFLSSRISEWILKAW